MLLGPRFRADYLKGLHSDGFVHKGLYYFSLRGKHSSLFCGRRKEREKSFELTPREQEGKFKCCAAK